MKNAVWWLVAVLLGIAIGEGLYYLLQHEGKLLSPTPTEIPSISGGMAEQPEVSEPEIRHPIEQVRLPPAEQDKSDTPEPGVQEEPLPPLDQSDDVIRASLEQVMDPEPVETFFFAKDLIRRVVSTVDNLIREKVSLKIRVVKPVAGQFLVTGKEDDSYTINPDNMARYNACVTLAEAVDTESLIAFYVRFYPLFQRAYLDLGYPSGYFNDRLVEVIDNLLAAPDVQEPIRLVRPHVLYKFADPKLEALSAGQKILVRIGSENAGRIKAKLREIRSHLTAQVIGQTPPFPKAGGGVGSPRGTPLPLNERGRDVVVRTAIAGWLAKYDTGTGMSGLDSGYSQSLSKRFAVAGYRHSGKLPVDVGPIPPAETNPHGR